MPAVLAALLVLALLVLLAGLYVRCRLSMLLWYRNRYGKLEINGEAPGKGTDAVPPALGKAFPGPGACPCAEPSLALHPSLSPWLSPDGKLYDAYVSHATTPDDRKFVHFIVKPQLENRYGYKLFLDEQTILPNSGRHQTCAGLGRGVTPAPGGLKSLRLQSHQPT